MTELSAFIGHGFNKYDADIVREYLEFFNSIRDMGIGFSWEHAESAEPKLLKEKVLQKMKDKNLFIGIFTKKECVIEPDKLHTMFLRKNCLKANKSDFENKTSDWLIQELGFAVGRAMDIIIILEEGLKRPGGLQGDIEHIPFKRKSPSESFTKILEMILSLKPKPIDQETGLVKQQEEEEVDRHESADPLNPSDDWTYKEYSLGLWISVIMDNPEKEEEIYQKYSDTLEPEDKSSNTAWQAERLYLQYSHKKKDTLQQIKDLLKECPDNPKILKYIGRIHEAYKQYDIASNQFEYAAEIESESIDKLKDFSTAAQLCAKQGDINSKIRILNRMLQLKSDCVEGADIILSTISDIATTEGDDDNFIAFSEAVLVNNPDDHERRFALAYKYAELAEDDLALFHYLLLVNVNPTGTNWNNLGVAQQNLGLPSKAIRSYRQSENLLETLAMSNIARRFIYAGFIDEAQDICNRATKIENFNKNIGHSITMIKTTLEDEKKKEEEIIEKAGMLRKYYVSYSKACLETPIKDFKADYLCPEGRFGINIKNNTLEGNAFIVAGDPSWVTTHSTEPVLTIHFKGSVFGRGAIFTRWITELNDKELGTSRKGMMIFSDDFNEISVYEKGSRTTERYYTMNKVTN